MSHTLYLFNRDNHVTPEWGWDPIDQLTSGITWRNRKVPQIVDIVMEFIEEIDIIDLLSGKTTLTEHIDIPMTFIESMDIVFNLYEELDIETIVEEYIVFRRSKKY